jgi:hypothetical protein
MNISQRWMKIATNVRELGEKVLQLEPVKLQQHEEK